MSKVLWRRQPIIEAEWLSAIPTNHWSTASGISCWYVITVICRANLPPTRYLPYRSLEVGKGHWNIREAGIHGIFFFLQASHLTLVMHQHNLGTGQLPPH